MERAQAEEAAAACALLMGISKTQDEIEDAWGKDDYASFFDGEDAPAPVLGLAADMAKCLWTSHGEAIDVEKRPPFGKIIVQSEGDGHLWFGSNGGGNIVDAAEAVGVLQERYKLGPVGFSWCIQEVPVSPEDPLMTGGVYCEPGHPPKYISTQEVIRDENEKALTRLAEKSPEKAKRRRRAGFVP